MYTYVYEKIHLKISCNVLLYVYFYIFLICLLEYLHYYITYLLHIRNLTVQNDSISKFIIMIKCAFKFIFTNEIKISFNKRFHIKRYYNLHSALSTVGTVYT